MNDSDDDSYDNFEIRENFSPGCAVFREYLEELFNMPEFEGAGTGGIEDRLLRNEKIRDIEKMLADGKADFRFLGIVLDMTNLRHELSFALVIHDESYADYSFIANEECKKGQVHSIPIDVFDDDEFDIWDSIHGPSAAMWDLFVKTDLFKSIKEYNKSKAK